MLSGVIFKEPLLIIPVAEAQPKKARIRQIIFFAVSFSLRKNSEKIRIHMGDVYIIIFATATVARGIVTKYRVELRSMQTMPVQTNTQIFKLYFQQFFVKNKYNKDHQNCGEYPPEC